jgi:hypothetical protein
MISPGNTKPEAPPERIRVRPNAQGNESIWTIDPQRHIEILTIQNNVGLLQMYPGSALGGQPRIRFALELWGLPAKMIQLDWDEEVPPQGIGGPLKLLFKKELLLR